MCAVGSNAQRSGASYGVVRRCGHIESLRSLKLQPGCQASVSNTHGTQLLCPATLTPCSRQAQARGLSGWFGRATAVPHRSSGLLLACPMVQAAAHRVPLRIWAARIGGVEIPNKKMIEFSLQYVYGIGHTTAKAILSETVRAYVKWNSMGARGCSSRTAGPASRRCRPMQCLFVKAARTRNSDKAASKHRAASAPICCGLVSAKATRSQCELQAELSRRSSRRIAKSCADPEDRSVRRRHCCAFATPPEEGYFLQVQP